MENCKESASTHQTWCIPEENEKAVDYSLERERLKSYVAWQVHFPVSPAKLAKAGFYYTGKDDEVVCFSCHGHIKNWCYGDVVLRKHIELFPHCDFVNHKSNNVAINQKYVNENDTSAFKTYFPSRAKDFERLKFLDERLQTFNEKWPSPLIDFIKLAKAGFFYLGRKDIVQCAFCKGKLFNWEPKDDPLKEHFKHFPSCSFLCHIENKSHSNYLWFQSSEDNLCENIPRQEKTSKLINESREHVKLVNLGVQFHNGPIHPEYALLDSRLNSLSSWPNTSPVSKTLLAEAGFYYLGYNDYTKCFHCNGGLCQWVEGDDPWFEHARWFKNCDYLRMSKGQFFIDSCIRKHHLEKAEGNISEKWQCESEFLMAKVDEAMSSSVILKVLESGLFPYYIIRAAVLEQLKATGKRFRTVDDVCLAVTYLKDKMEKEPYKKRENEPFKINSLKAADLNICNINLEDTSKISTDENIDISSLFITSDDLEPVEPLSTPFKSDSSNVKTVNSDTLTKDQTYCKICMDKEVGVVFLPCGHLLACIECSNALKLCPMCRKSIQATVRVYLP